MKVKKNTDLKTTRVQPVVMGTSTDGKPSQRDTRVAASHPKRRSDLNYRTIDGETLILNRKDGRLHQLNPTASFIWDCCDGNSNIVEIIDRLAGAYEVDSGRARKDVEQTLSKLQNSNLLESN
jgi:Coenzyme PQQ synthesis protein D (PqqD)